MANLIELAKSYVPMLDEVYKLASCTSDLDGAPELARQGANANELIIPMLEMDGLADYDRNGGYVAGDVKMENRTVQCNFDRGRMFTVDTMDNAETAGLAFGRLAAEFIRTKVVPELDAFRFACYAGKPGISSAEATLSSGADVIAAISAAVTEMDENEVPSDPAPPAHHLHAAARHQRHGQLQIQRSSGELCVRQACAPAPILHRHRAVER